MVNLTKLQLKQNYFLRQLMFFTNVVKFHIKVYVYKDN